MANTLNKLRAQRASQQTRGQNVVAGILCGVPTTNTEIVAMTGGMAATVVAIELISPVPMTVVGCIGEAIIGVAAACGVKSAIQGRHFWKAAIMGSDMDKLEKEATKAADEAKPGDKPRFCSYCGNALEGDKCPHCGAMSDDYALDSNLRPVRSRVTPWQASEQETNQFVREHGAEQIH